jgi:hypothetical protein
MIKRREFVGKKKAFRISRDGGATSESHVHKTETDEFVKHRSTGRPGTAVLALPTYRSDPEKKC